MIAPAKLKTPAAAALSPLQNEPTFSNLWIVVAAALALLVVLELLVWQWGSTRGFDLTDEGFYFLTYQHPSWYPSGSNFAFLGKMFVPLCADEVLSFRYWELVTRLGGPLVLCFATKSWLQSLSPARAMPQWKFFSLCCLGILGSMCSFAILPRALAYNGMATLFILLSLSCFLWAQVYVTKKAVFSFFIAFAGFFTGACFFAKFTSSVAFIGAFSAAICLLHGRKSLQPILMLVTGLSVAFCLYFLCLQSPYEFVDNFLLKVFGLVKAGGHSGSAILGPLLHQAIHNLIRLPFLLLGAAGISAMLVVRKKFPGVATRLIAPSFLISALALGTLAFKTQLLTEKHALYLPLLLGLCISCGILVAEREHRNVEWKTVVVGAIFMWSPLLLSFGTDLDIVVHAQCNLAAYFVLTGIVLFSVGIRLRNDAIPIAGVCVASILAVISFYNGYVYHPFNLGTTLFEQVNPINLKRVQNFTFDRQTYKFLVQTHDVIIKNGFVEGDPILNLYRTPGVAYVMGGRSIEKSFFLCFQDTPNMFERSPNFDDFDRLFICTTSEVPRPSATERLTPEMRQSLASKGTPFPDHFQQIGTAVNPPLLKDGGQTEIFTRVQAAHRMGKGSHQAKPDEI